MAKAVLKVQLGVGAPSRTEVVAVAREGAEVELAPDAIKAIAHSRSVIEALASDPIPHYGVSTGFGALASKHIPFESRAQLQ
ncbi:MAG: aromatic amino acid lyase, partial [Cryobacterium sp.]|nr:aromatic amino acid lyase [Cryobacterium sp.]